MFGSGRPKLVKQLRHICPQTLRSRYCGQCLQSMKQQQELEKPSAFKLAEKSYQLYRAPASKYRYGRGHGGKLVTRPTDLSKVLDFTRHPAHDVETVTVVRSPLLPGPAYKLAWHPGLVVIPGAVSHGLQRRLLVDALQSFPEPPATTNHTRELGQLSGLWQAACAGRLLLGTPPGLVAPESPAVRADFSCAGTPTLSAWVTSTSGPQPARPQTKRSLGKCEGSCSRNQHICQPPGQRGCSSGGSSSPSAVAEGTAVTTQQVSQAQQPTPIAAKKLLRKLRWATLGPAFDWTRRCYGGSPGRPIPPYLQQLATRLAAAAHSAITAESVIPSDTSLSAVLSRAQSGGHDSCSHPGASGTCQCAAPGASIRTQVNTSLADLACGEDCDAAEPAVPCWTGAAPHDYGSSEQAFHPDAAIVNYYHEGDTLGGHVDDAEADLSQPIVSISIGCDAVFLMGGVIKDTVPTALLLRSGDALVLSGQARRCFHGVPRILCDRQVPAAFNNDGACAWLQPFLEYIHRARINISLRAIG